MSKLQFIMEESHFRKEGRGPSAPHFLASHGCSRCSHRWPRTFCFALTQPSGWCHIHSSPLISITNQENNLQKHPQDSLMGAFLSWGSFFLGDYLLCVKLTETNQHFYLGKYVPGFFFRKSVPLYVLKTDIKTLVWGYCSVIEPLLWPLKTTNIYLKMTSSAN